jgi:hypothetical protein
MSNLPCPANRVYAHTDIMCDAGMSNKDLNHCRIKFHIGINNLCVDSFITVVNTVICLTVYLCLWKCGEKKLGGGVRP